MKQKLQKILVAIPTNGPDGRFRLAGVLRFASSKPQWDLRIVSSRTALNDREVNALIQEGIQGCILAAYTPAIEQLLATGVPCVVVLENLMERLDRFPNCRAVFTDNAEVGTAAAEFFKSLGCFSSYAFVPAPPAVRWSLERKAAFRAAADRRASFYEFPETDFEKTNLSGENGIQMQPEAIEEFLRRLPKPAAVFAANDLLAIQVLKAARNARIKTPADVAVVGCDNDEILCLNARPSLTSILPNFDLAGFTAAKLLNDMIRRVAVPEETVRIGKVHIYQRGSTANLPPAVVLVSQAMEYIRAHATEGISTADVLAHLRVSRSLLDLRFRQVRKESVMDAILNIRLEAVKRGLAATNRSILAIGTDCGFGNADYLKRLFKSRFGMSMRDYRRLTRQ